MHESDSGHEEPSKPSIFDHPTVSFPPRPQPQNPTPTLAVSTPTTDASQRAPPNAPLIPVRRAQIQDLPTDVINHIVQLFTNWGELCYRRTLGSVSFLSFTWFCAARTVLFSHLIIRNTHADITLQILRSSHFETVEIGERERRETEGYMNLFYVPGSANSKKEAPRTRKRVRRLSLLFFVENISFHQRKVEGQHASSYKDPLIRTHWFLESILSFLLEIATEPSSTFNHFSSSSPFSFLGGSSRPTPRRSSGFDPDSPAKLNVRALLLNGQDFARTAIFSVVPWSMDIKDVPPAPQHIFLNVTELHLNRIRFASMFEYLQFISGRSFPQLETLTLAHIRAIDSATINLDFDDIVTGRAVLPSDSDDSSDESSTDKPPMRYPAFPPPAKLNNVQLTVVDTQQSYVDYVVLRWLALYGMFPKLKVLAAKQHSEPGGAWNLLLACLKSPQRGGGGGQLEHLTIEQTVKSGPPPCIPASNSPQYIPVLYLPINTDRYSRGLSVVSYYAGLLRNMAAAKWTFRELRIDLPFDACPRPVNPLWLASWEKRVKRAQLAALEADRAKSAAARKTGAAAAATITPIRLQKWTWVHSTMYTDEHVQKMEAVERNMAEQFAKPDEPRRLPPTAPFGATALVSASAAAARGSEKSGAGGTKLYKVTAQDVDRAKEEEKMNPLPSNLAGAELLDASARGPDATWKPENVALDGVSVVGEAARARWDYDWESIVELLMGRRDGKRRVSRLDDGLQGDATAASAREEQSDVHNIPSAFPTLTAIDVRVLVPSFYFAFEIERYQFEEWVRTALLEATGVGQSSISIKIQRRLMDPGICYGIEGVPKFRQTR